MVSYLKKYGSWETILRRKNIWEKGREHEWIKDVQKGKDLMYSVKDRCESFKERYFIMKINTVDDIRRH